MIFLTGPHGAGKTRAAYFLANHNFYLIDLGPTIRGIHKEQAPHLSFGEWVKRGEVEYGEDFTNQLLLVAVNNEIKLAYQSSNPPDDIVIAGCRSVKGLMYLKENLIIPNSKEVTTIFIDAPFELLMERYNRREGKSLSKEEFKEVLIRDSEMGLDGLREVADTYIMNDSDEFTLETSINKELKL